MASRSITSSLSDEPSSDDGSCEASPRPEAPGSGPGVCGAGRIARMEARALPRRLAQRAQQGALRHKPPVPVQDVSVLGAQRLRARAPLGPGEEGRGGRAPLPRQPDALLDALQREHRTWGGEESAPLQRGLYPIKVSCRVTFVACPP